MDKSINEALIALNLKKVYEELDQLKSKPGIPGPQGLRGERGFTGERGPIGEQGIPGLDGKNGLDGRDGIDGKDGLQGPIGEQGIPGIPGKDGRDGIDGKDGAQGPKGEKGDQGLPGLNGKDGRDGIDGKDGRDGIDGKDGLDGKDGRNGIDGKDGLDGKDGRDGIDGKDGLDGKDGRDGIDGKDGLQGPKGDRGEPGLKGDKGDKGDPGERGPEGPAGKDAVIPDIIPIVEKGVAKAQDDFNRWRANVNKSLASIGGGGVGIHDVLKEIEKAQLTGGGSGNANITVSTTPPTGVVEGALWWASDEGQLYIYYDDQWIQAAESVLARETVLLDSAAVINLIDSDYINARVVQSSGTDSATVIGLITSTVDSDYVNARVSVSGLTDIVNDTSPQLGGDLDLNSHNITGTGSISATGDVSGYAFNGRIGSVTGTTVDASFYPVFVSAIQPDQYLEANSGLSYNPNSGILTATRFNGGFAGTLAADLNAQSFAKIINLPTPTNDGDAASKGYVDGKTEDLADNRLVYIRSGNTNVNSSTDTVLDWNSELVASTIPDFTYSSGVFTNTSTRTRRFLFQMQVAIRAQSTAFTEANIWFSFNGTFNSTNRRGQTNFTASTSAVMLTTSWTFTLAQNETVRGYFWCNQASVYGNTQSPPSSSFGNQYSSLIEVQELN